MFLRRSEGRRLALTDLVEAVYVVACVAAVAVVVVWATVICFPVDRLMTLEARLTFEE